MPRDRSPAELARIATMAMRRRPMKGFDTVKLSGPERALASFKAGQQRLAGRFADAALLAVAAELPEGANRWDYALMLAARRGEPAPRYTSHHRALLGKPTPATRARLLPRPPAPRPKPAPRTRAGRSAAMARHPSSSSTPTSTRSPRPQADLAALVAAMSPPPMFAAGPISPADARYNADAARRLGLSPRSVAHLTRARP